MKASIYVATIYVATILMILGAVAAPVYADIPGSLVAWGDNYFGQATPPAGNDFVAIAAGSHHGLAIMTEHEPRTYYVNGTTGNDSWDGLASNWDGVHGPKATIQAGVDAAGDGDTVVVAEGIYTGVGNHDIEMWENSITLRSESGALKCIIDCQQEGRGLCVYGFGKNFVIDGFTIKNGYVSGYHYDGGGVYHDEGDLVVQNCIITNNRANTGGGIASKGQTTTIKNCTIVNNQSLAYAGIAVPCFANLVTITNCIVWGNVGEEYDPQIGVGCGECGAPDRVSVSYSDIQCGLYSVHHCSGELDWGPHNIDAAPLFVDSSSGDFHLLPDSPCINAGDPTGDYTDQTDIDGEPRVINGRVDIGADEVYESPLPAWTISGTVTDDATGEPIEGATVLIIAKDGHFKKDATTDELGYYVLSGLAELTANMFPCYLKVLAEGYAYKMRKVEYNKLLTGLVADFQLTAGTILYVPYYNQGETGWCGPTSLSMALKNGNIDFKPWKIAAEYSLAVTPAPLEFPFPVKDCCVNKLGIGCTERHWSVPPWGEPIADMLEYVKAEVDRGRSVVLTMPSPMKHAVVIVGYDESDNLYINDPSGHLFEEIPEYEDDWAELLLGGCVPWRELQQILEKSVGGNDTYTPLVSAGVNPGTSCYTRNNTLGVGGAADQSSDQLLFMNSGGSNELALRLDGKSALGYCYHNTFGNHPELLHSSLKYAALPVDSLMFSPYICNALPYGLDDAELHLWIGKILPNGDELIAEDGDLGYRTVPLHPFCSLYDDERKLLGNEGEFGTAFTLSSLEPGYDYCLHLEVYRSAESTEPAEELSFRFHLLDQVVVPIAGGTVTLLDDDTNPENDTRIEILSGAIQEDTVISITKVDAAPGADYALGGIDPRWQDPVAAYEIAGRDEQGNEMPVNFLSPVTLYLAYPDADDDGYVDGTSPPLYESSLRVWTWNSGLNRWDYIFPTWVDGANNVVWLLTTHLSTFSLFMPTFIEAKMDLDPDVINPKSKGKWITCYIELPEEFDVTHTDLSTIRLNGTISPDLSVYEFGDYNRNEIMDLMVKFDRQSLIAAIGETAHGQNIEFTLTGRLPNGAEIVGSISIRVLTK